jgi:mxaK protein
MIGAALDLLAQAWRRTRSAALLALLALSIIGAIASAMAVWRAHAEADALAALAAGRDIEVEPNAAPELIAARIGYLARREAFDRARALLAPLDAAERGHLAAGAHYDLANAMLRRAFALLEQSKLEAAGPFVDLARRGYRRALQFDPDFWDAKYNLDVASRLVRDNPQLERTSGDELPADPKKIWTDIPGAPKGLP